MRRQNKDEEICALILTLLEIPHDHAKLMTPSQIRSLVECDHYPVAVHTATGLGWTPEQVNHPSNLQFLTGEAHLKKTNAIDKKNRAKSRRIEKKTSPNATFTELVAKQFRRQYAHPADTGAALVETHRPRRPWPSKAVDGSKRSKWKKPLKGPAVRR